MNSIERTLSPESDGVGVILIVRNGERFITDALNSVQAQTLRPAEILVIDGHSDDGTVATGA